MVERTPRRPGRPSKLTPELTKRIVTGIRAGAYPEVAARAAGIHPSTYYAWMADERSQFAEFQEEIERARAADEQRSVAVVAASDDWRAHAWKLERQHPDRWGKREKGEVDHTTHEEQELVVRVVYEDEAMAG